MKRVWESEEVIHRESMRKNVEDHATSVFTQISPLANTGRYNGLRISSEFRIDIISKRGKRDAGSSGQSAFVAYAVIDALSRASGIEFPFIIDTPSVSIDNEGLDYLFDYLLFDTSPRQVIILPEGKELKPTEGDDKYGAVLARSYSIQHDDENSVLLERVDNS
jgi:hypothetical protein